MKINTFQKKNNWKGVKKNYLVAFVFDSPKIKDSVLAEIERFFSQSISNTKILKDFTGEVGKTISVNFTGSKSIDGITLIGLGDINKFNIDLLRRVSGITYRELNEKKIKIAAILIISEHFKSVSEYEIGESIAEGLILSSFSYTLQTSSKPENSISEITLAITEAKNIKNYQKGISDAVSVCEQVNMARELISSPANHMTPTIIANKAKFIASSIPRIKCKIITADEAKKKGMGSFLSVTKGSSEPAKIIILEYNPTAMRKLKTVALVGKGVTFDSGGISLKPAKDMHKMKYDMAGGAAVIGTIAAVARLKLPVRVVGIIPATENLPDGKATKPGDIVKSLSGKTIEIQNTDAEGRLILADCLTYALRFKPSAIIDIATLTGACVIALGSHAMGMMSNNEKLKKLLNEAGNNTHERVWELPVWDDYFDDIKSDVADIKNIGDGSAGTIAGAMFLKQFVDEVPWVHLDIAGTAWIEKKHDYLARGASGSGIRLFVKFLSLFAKDNN
ncbi:MAG: leucyl aminopeptidase [Candidatus Schekmanbacteria bacterium]|nr:leucyl aminopeptidase [Candidatus Schekmanbacteria bacterium]